VQGTVTNPDGAAIEGARIELLGGPDAPSTLTAHDGTYRLAGVAPGSYRLRVTAPGFAPIERPIEITATGGVTADLRLAAQPLREDIEVVAAARYPRSAGELPVSATVVSRQTALASPERSVDGLLRHVSGVQLPANDVETLFPLQPSLAMRGLGVGDTADRGLVLLDGLPLNSGFFGNVAWNRAPKRTLDRIEVVRGASSSLFGTFALGGVVDVVTYAPEQQETVVDLQYGQYARTQANVLHGDALPSGSRYVLNANWVESDGYYVVPDEDRRPIDQPQANRLFNVQGRLETRLGERTTGFVRTGYNDQHQDGSLQNAGTDSDQFDIAGGLDMDLAGTSELALRLMYAREEFDVRNVSIVDDDTTFVANPHRTESDDVGLSAQWSQSWSGTVSEVVAGIDVRRVDGEDEQDVFNSPGVLDRHVVGGGVQTSAGLFGQLTVHPGAGSEILIGARVDRFDNSDGEIVTNGASTGFDGNDLTVVSPRVAGRVGLGAGVGLRGAVFGGFRAPTLAELYRSFESPTFRGLSNPNLEEERLAGGDLGVEIHRGRFAGQLNGFYNRLEDFVGSAEVGFVDGKFTVQASNVAEVRSRGVEVMGSVEVTAWLTVGGHYTYTDAEVTEGPLEGNAVEGAPERAYGLTLTYVGPRFTASAKWRYVGETFQDITNEAPQDAYSIVDLLAEWRPRPWLALFAAAENVFDDEYVADGFGGELGAPRQVSGGVRLRL
jgi:outer membrane cobalamin receptor